ncbi:MAG: ANTAR domain-containing protein [Clostridia bacterium]|nr:ANTAR domain-containing protein [Clostridia bacterium]
MDYKERVYSVLVVSSSEKFNATLKELLSSERYSPVKFKTDINSANRELLERKYDFVIINSPIHNDDGIRLAIEVTATKSTAVLVMVKDEFYLTTYERVSPFGIFALPKPTTKQILMLSFDFMASMNERLSKLEKKTTSLEDRMHEIRIINRAKWILIEKFKMSEEEAHKVIEKRAMNASITKREVAEDIINTNS